MEGVWKKFAAIFQFFKHVIKSVINFEPQLGLNRPPPCIRTSMHAGATDCSARPIAVPSPPRRVIGTLDIEFAAKLMFVLFMPRRSGLTGHQWLWVIDAVRLSRSFMGMQKTLRYWPRGKIRCLTRRVVRRGGERGETQTNSFSCHAYLPLYSSTSLFFYLSNPLSTVADVFSWLNRME